MSEISTKEKIEYLKRAAHKDKTASVYLRALDDPEAQEMALRLERSAAEKLDLVRSLKIEARLDKLNVYTVEMKKTVRKGEIKT